MSVSSRLSFCTVMPVGSTPMIATKPNATTARLSAISTMVNAWSPRGNAGRGLAGLAVLILTRIIDFLGRNHSRAASEPVDANAWVIRVVAFGRFDHFGRGECALFQRVFIRLLIDNAALGDRHD